MRAWRKASESKPQHRQTVVVRLSSDTSKTFAGWTVAGYDGVVRWWKFDPLAGLTQLGRVVDDDVWMPLPEGSDA